MKFPWKKHKPQALKNTLNEDVIAPHEWREDLYQACLDWRRTYARLHGLALEAVLTDNQLKQIAYAEPLTEKEFKNLGFDALRTDLFEEAIVLLVSTFRDHPQLMQVSDDITDEDYAITKHEPNDFELDS